MSSQQSILVLGAGELGTAVLQSLAQHPSRKSTTLTVLLRQATISTQDPSKRAQVDKLKTLGIQLLAGDIVADSENELASKFQNFHTVIGCSGMTGDSGTQLKLTRAALAAKVKRYFPWQFGVDYDVIGRGSSQNLFTEQLDVRDLLRSQSATSWIIISTGMFMSFVFEDSFGIVTKDRSTVRALGSWDTRVTVTCVEDIALMTAEIVLAEPDMKNLVIHIAGDTVSYSTIADIVEKVDGRKVKREEWTIPKLKEGLAEDPENGLKKYRIVFAEGTGVSWDKEVTLNVKKNIALQGVEEWLQNHRN